MPESHANRALLAPFLAALAGVAMLSLMNAMYAMVLVILFVMQGKSTTFSAKVAVKDWPTN